MSTVAYLFILFSATLIGTSFLPQARAATGIVCIANPSLNPSSCPSTSATFSGATGSTFTVAVNIQGSDSVNGFDISVQTAPSILQPVNITTTNSIIHDPKLVLTSSAGGTTGIARLAMVAEGYSIGAPVTGNLFNIVYKVVSASSGSWIVFQPGCTGTSVPNTCLTVANGMATDSESVQTGSFGTNAMPDFTMTAQPSSQTVNSGSTTSSAVVLTSLNGFSGTVQLSATPPPVCPACPSWTLSPTSVTVPVNSTISSTLTFTSPAGEPASTWHINVTGMSGSLVHSVNATFQVVIPPSPDFSISTNPSGFTIVQGGSGSSTITISSLNGFSGSVTLSTTVSPTGPTASVSPNNLLVPSGGSNSSTLTVSTTSSTPPGTYNVTVTGSSGSLAHSAVVTVSVTSPTPPPIPGLVCIAPGSSINCPARPASFQGTTGTQLTVAVNVQNSSALIGFDIQVLTNPSILKPVSTSLSGTVLGANPLVLTNSVGSATGLVRVAATSTAGHDTTPPTTGRFFSITYNITSATPGTFILFPTGCSGSSNDSICVTVAGGSPTAMTIPEDIQEANFTATSPDFSLTASPSSTTITKGSSAIVTISATSLQGFAGTVNLSLSISPNIKKGPGLALAQSTLTLTIGTTSSTSLTITTNGGSAAGTYTITITGQSGSLIHTATITVTVVARH